MAERHQQLTPGAVSRWWARVVTALVLAALACGFLPVLFLGLGEGLPRFDPYLWRVLGFTLLQAGLSTFLSLVLGLALARALSRRRFLGRALILRLLNLPLALPAIVAVIGLIAVWGEAGWLSGVIPLYGLSGILLAHVFFNAPLIARLILVELERTPAEAWRLGASLGFNDAAHWRHIEWPAIKGALPGALLLVFLLCASSFAIVLTLGGGPSATTLEVAIYQALRADFDPARAAALSSVQMVLSCLLIFAARLAGGALPAFQPLRLTPRRFDGEGLLAKAIDGIALAVTLLLLLPPLAAITLDGVAALISPANNLGPAILTSLAIAAASTLLTLLLLWPLGERAARSHRWRRGGGVLVLSAWILPPAVLATGWFIAAQGFVASGSLAAPLVVLMNALIALPFAYQVMAPAQAALASANDRLAASLGLFGWNRFRLIDLLQLGRPLRLAAALAFILSLGDLTAITLFGTESLVTLPALIRQQMGGYRFDEAAGSALVLGLLVFCFLALSEGGRRKS